MKLNKEQEIKNKGKEEKQSQDFKGREEDEQNNLRNRGRSIPCQQQRKPRNNLINVIEFLINVIEFLNDQMPMETGLGKCSTLTKCGSLEEGMSNPSSILVARNP